MHMLGFIDQRRCLLFKRVARYIISRSDVKKYPKAPVQRLPRAIHAQTNSNRPCRRFKYFQCLERRFSSLPTHHASERPGVCVRGAEEIDQSKARTPRTVVLAKTPLWRLIETPLPLQHAVDMFN